MTFRLGEEQASLRAQGTVCLGEERAGVGYLVHDEDGEDEIDASRQIFDIEPGRLRATNVEPVHEAGLQRAAAQDLQHPFLEVHGHDTAAGPDHPGEVQREEAHPGSGLQHGHAPTDERAEQLPRAVANPCGDGRLLRHLHVHDPDAVWPISRALSSNRTFRAVSRSARFPPVSRSIACIHAREPKGTT